MHYFVLLIKTYQMMKLNKNFRSSYWNMNPFLIHQTNLRLTHQKLIFLWKKNSRTKSSFIQNLYILNWSRNYRLKGRATNIWWNSIFQCFIASQHWTSDCTQAACLNKDGIPINLKEQSVFPWIWSQLTNVHSISIGDPSPCTDKILQELMQYKYFSEGDLDSGYHQFLL